MVRRKKLPMWFTTIKGEQTPIPKEAHEAVNEWARLPWIVKLWYWLTRKPILI